MLTLVEFMPLFCFVAFVSFMSFLRLVPFMLFVALPCFMSLLTFVTPVVFVTACFMVVLVPVVLCIAIMIVLGERWDRRTHSKCQDRSKAYPNQFHCLHLRLSWLPIELIIPSNSPPV